MHVQDHIHLTSEPTTSMNYSKQIYAEVVNRSSSFLDQLKEMKSQIQSLLIMQCMFPQMWSRSTHAGQTCPPPTLW